MSQWAELRHQHFVEGVSKKTLARRFGLDVKPSDGRWSARSRLGVPQGSLSCLPLPNPRPPA